MKSFLFTIGIIAAGLLSMASAQQPSQSASRDQVHIAVQEICPVSGQELGSMGPPIKVKIGDEVLFLCCKSCLQGKVNPKHWATIHAHFAKAQGICPVMKDKLPENPKWTIVDGQIVYVCCPKCIEEITADPKPYLRAVDGLYLASLRARSSTR